MRVSLRPATAADVPFLVEIANRDDVEPFLSGRQPRDPEAVAAEVERSEREPERGERLVVEVDGERAGTVTWRLLNEPSRIARLERFALLPAHRGTGAALEASRQLQRRLLVERGLHRLELEVYAFNERAIAQAEKAGYVREGVKRQAYRRHGRWNDAVLFSLLREDLDGGE